MLLNRFLLWPERTLRLYVYYKPLPFDRRQYQSFKNLPYISAEKNDDKFKTNANPTSGFKTSTSFMAKSICKETGTPGSSGKNTASPKRQDFIKRATYSGKCRWGFVPEEFFLFFYPLTGVSGAYLFVFGIVNFMLSKEIYILEHEYYTGLSIFVMLVYVVKAFGKSIGQSLDKQVDAVLENLKKGRQDEIQTNQKTIDHCSDLQLRAKSQKLLMDGKKENIAMQLEAAYRERAMLLYRRVKGRLDYHVMRQRTETRIEQKWMLEWILAQVRKSITPEFEKKALLAAINDLASAADRYKKTK